jgi:hypothetical protein
MKREDIISGLKMTIGLFLFDPTTGNTLEKHMLNDTDRTTVEACEGAIKLLSGATYMDGYKDGYNSALNVIEMKCEEVRK